MNPLSDRQAFQDAVRSALDDAAGEERLALVDPDFADWPLGEPATLALLTRWARGRGRELVLLAQHFDALPRRHPRFVAWRRTFDHVVRPYAVAAVDDNAFPTLLLAAGKGLQLLDRRYWRWRWLEEGELPDRRELVDALLQRSQPAFGASTLGL